VSQLRRLRQAQKLMPSFQTRLISTVRKHWIFILSWVGVPSFLDLLREYARAKAMDWVFDYLAKMGSIGKWIANYPFALLTISLVLIIVWLVSAVIQESRKITSSLILNEEGGPYQIQEISKAWSAGFGIAAIICIILIGYGAYKYTHLAQTLEQKGKDRTEAKSYAPASAGTAVLVQPGGKWISTDDTVNGAIENRGKIDSENLQVNPTNPSTPPVTHERVVLKQLWEFVEDGESLRQDSDLSSWVAKVGQYINDNVDKNLAAKFVEAPTFKRKRKVLLQCTQLMTQKIHAH
jgi:hypothetical protein